MKPAKKYVIALVTTPDRKVARKLARTALKARLAACANLIPRIESHYWWQGDLECASETLILFKTTRRCLEKLEKLILAKHPYDTPEFVVVPLIYGSRRYLLWLERSV